MDGVSGIAETGEAVATGRELKGFVLEKSLGGKFFHSFHDTIRSIYLSLIVPPL